MTALAKVAHLAKIPTFTTASVPGPLITVQPGRGLHPVNRPDQRLGQPGVGEGIEGIKRKTLLVAGMLTSVSKDRERNRVGPPGGRPSEDVIDERPQHGEAHRTGW